MFDRRNRIRRPLTLGLVIATILALVAGCASNESTAPASAADAASLDADHIFGAAVSGYAFVKLPKSLEREARRQFEASAGLDEDEAELDLRSLTKGGTGTSVVLVVTLSPEYAALPGTEKGFAVGMAKSAGTEPDKIAIGSADGYAVDNGAQTIVAWQDQNLLVAVFAERRAAAVDAARAIVEATS
jgi:hypothetical protein